MANAYLRRELLWLDLVPIQHIIGPFLGLVTPISQSRLLTGLVENDDLGSLVSK